MSNPYGPPAGGQQGSGSYPGQGPAWGPGQGAGPYGAPPSYGQPAGGSTPAGQGYVPGPAFGGGGPGQGGPGQGGPGQGGPGQGGMGAGSDGPGQWGGPPPAATTPKAPKAPRPPGTGPDLNRILPLVSGVLGVIAFIAGFLPSLSAGDGTTSVSVTVFGGGPSYLPILLLVVGLLAVAPLIPGGKKFTLVTVLLSVAGLLGAIGALATSNIYDLASSGATTSTGFGLILLLIVAVLLVASTGFGWLTESGILKPAAPSAGRPSSGPASSPYGNPGQSSQPAPVPSAPAAPSGQGSYGGYPPGGYQPPADSYQPYGQSSVEPATSGQPNPSPAAPATGSTPAVDPPLYGGSYGQGPSTGQHGRDDGPPPDVTQQVRF
ncbi:hypothetical protein ABIB25_001866 [Nakamurella sp. UYEF19]|uniref:DUF5336 domain-containing protein n=1 Tax=Nakamurella sp. UYEF19 TaxID=1756392 RepID=UPI00339A604E